MGAVAFDEAIPILRILPVERVKEFNLGFTLDWEHRFDDTCRSAAGLARRLHARLLEVTDPFGNRIRFNEDDSPR